jgi:hypothetical protein
MKEKLGVPRAIGNSGDRNSAGIPGTQYLIIDNQNEICEIILHGTNSENSSAAGGKVKK